jgi:transposase
VSPCIHYTLSPPLSFTHGQARGTLPYGPIRKTKTDKKDASTIAQFLLAHEDSLRKVTFSQDLQDLKNLARERESLIVLISGQ